MRRRAHARVLRTLASRLQSRGLSLALTKQSIDAAGVRQLGASSAAIDAEHHSKRTLQSAPSRSAWAGARARGACSRRVLLAPPPHASCAGLRVQAPAEMG
eukprot:6187318-Pleurochrysis_carterae.AAC.3